MFVAKPGQKGTITFQLFKLTIYINFNAHLSGGLTKEEGSLCNSASSVPPISQSGSD